MKFKLFLILWFIVCSGALTGCSDKLYCVQNAMNTSDYKGKPKAVLTYDQAKEVCGVGK